MGVADKASSPAPRCFQSPHSSRGATRKRFQLRFGTHGRAGDGVLPYRRQGNSLREPVLEPDALIIQDATLLHQVDLFSGLPARGHILLNSTKSFDELGLGGFARGVQQYQVCTLPATELAEACRPSGAERSAPRRVRRDYRCDRAEIGVGRNPREIPYGYRREECRRCDGAFDIATKARETIDA